MTELEELVAQAVQAELAKAKGEVTETVPTSVTQVTPEKYNILGKEFTFNSRKEFEDAISQTVQSQNAEIERLKSAQTPQNRDGGYVTGKEAPVFSQDQYIDLMSKGPAGILDATKYAINHAIFEGKEPDVAGAIRNSLKESQNLKATLAVYQFRERHPEFQMNAQNTQVIDNLRGELGQGFTLEGLEAAYGVAQARGILPSPQVAAYHQKLINEGRLQAENTQQEQIQRTPALPNSAAAFNGGLGFQPPPTVSRSNPAPNGDLASMADNLTLEQLEKALRNAGQL